MSEAVGAKARLELARDILKIRESLATNTSIALKHLAANRIGSIRRVLLGREGGGLIDELLSPSMGMSKLNQMSDDLEATRDFSNPETIAKLNYIEALQSGLAALGHAERSAGAKFADLTRSISGVMASAEVANTMIDANIERGRIPKAIRDKLPELNALAGRSLAMNHDELLKEHAPEVYEAKMAVDAETRQVSNRLEETENELRKIKRLIGQGEGGEGMPGAQALEDGFVAAKANYEAAYKAYREHWDGVMLLTTAKARDAVKAAQAKLQAPLIEAAKAFTDSVVQASPVTAEQATAWAEAQDITPPARARLKKIGYDLKQVRQDMAEFYRFSGGRVVKVKVHSKGDRRANATGIEDHGKEGVIHLDSRFDKRVLWHELAHHIEADPVAKMTAGKFIRRRSVDGKAYSLRSLTKNNGYRSNESAFKDHFFNEYVGKIYNHGTTEVFSMGVESFSDPLTLGRRMAQDPETLEFVAGYLKQPIHPLAKAHMALRERLIDVSSEANEEAGSELEQMQQRLANGVEVIPDTDDQWLKDSGWDYHVKEKQTGRLPNSGWYVFEGLVRNPQTKRKSAGVILVKVSPADGTDFMGRPRTMLQKVELVGKGLTLAKLADVAWQKTGVFPSAYQLENLEYLRKIA